MIALPSLRRFFDAGSFERGQQRYEREGRVVTLDAEARGRGVLSLAAAVQGSGRRPYVQDIDVAVKGDSVQRVEGGCNCQVDHNCKRVAAAVIAWARRDTAADTVIHYDPWWNPAVEAQATDRAHRIGQDKPVFVYKLVTMGTVEERMVQLQERKRQLGEAVYDEAGGTERLLTAEDVDFLLAPIDA